MDQAAGVVEFCEFCVVGVVAAVCVHVVLRFLYWRLVRDLMLQEGEGQEFIWNNVMGSAMAALMAVAVALVFRLAQTGSVPSDYPVVAAFEGMYAFAIALPIGALIRRYLKPPARLCVGHCESCGYNLTGNESGRCPECGHPATVEA